MQTIKPTEPIELGGRRLPDGACVFCCKTLLEIGGDMIVATQERGVKLADCVPDDRRSGRKHQSAKLYADRELYMLTWGDAAHWTPEAHARARDAYLRGVRPWFCQICGDRICRQCGAPIRWAFASEVLSNWGSQSHVAIFPFDPGCINPECVRNRPASC